MFQEYIFTILYCFGYFALVTGYAWNNWQGPVPVPVRTLSRANRFVLILVATLGLASLAAAECVSYLDVENNDIATEATESEQETMSTSESKIKGIIEAIDLRNHSIQIKVKSCGMTTIVVRSDTKIRRNGKIVKLTSLKIGDKVAVKNPS